MGFDKLLEVLNQWYKIIGPAFIVLAIIIYGSTKFIYKMYTFNIEHKVESAFPSQFIIYVFFIWIIVVASIVLVLTILQSLKFNTTNQGQNSKGISA